MNGSSGDEREPSQHLLTSDYILSKSIEEALQSKANQITFTASQRQKVMQKIAARQRKQHTQRYMVPALVLAALIVIIASLATFTHITQPPVAHNTSTLSYTINQVNTVAPQLASGGELLALDPTEQHIAYQPAHQSGVIYTASITDPLHTNTRAMDYAQDMAWSNDGTTLVATVLPEHTNTSILAVVPLGHYMHPLSENALAVSWLPQTPTAIVYVTLENGTTQLWQTNIAGSTPHLVATLAISTPAQHMYWSPNGKYLALVVAGPHTDSKGSSATMLYLFNAQTKAVQQIAAADTYTIGNVAWSPNNSYLTFEHLSTTGKILQLENLNLQQPKSTFFVTSQHTLQGWSWASDSHAIVYSDNGTLYTHSVQGQTQAVTASNNHFTSPYWLKDGRILCLQVQATTNKLALLSPTTKMA